MIFPRLRRALPAAACAASALLQLSCATPQTTVRRDLNTALRPFGIEAMGPITLTVVKESRRRGTDKTFHSIIARSPDLRVKIEIIQPMAQDEVARYAPLRKRAMQALYEDPKTLYPGERAILARCPADRKPSRVVVPVLGMMPSGLLAYADEDLAFGACTEDEAKQVGIYMPFYDLRSKAFFQFSVFEPVDRYRRDAAGPLEDFLKGLKVRTPGP